MSILSFEFILFAIATVGVYYILPPKVRWIGLTVSSLVFYAFSGGWNLLYLLCVTGITYGGARWMGRLDTKNKKLQKVVLWLTIVLCMGAMLYLKYFDACSTAIKQLFNMMASQGEASLLDMLAPLGLSYFTFQSVGYVIDVYRGKIQAEKNGLKYLLFVSFFPQMTQGPISTYAQLSPQLLEPKQFEPENLTSGLLLALWGYFKKLVIADRLAGVTAVTPDQPGWMIALGLALYMVRLYADFSGGMDVVRGIARMLGIDMVENFIRPFFSRSVAEYWRRWHITLGTWFRSYVFYPLTISHGGLAVGKWGKKHFGKNIGRTLSGAITTLIIFLLIGLWHTANWNAVLYGTYFGLLLGFAMLLEPTLKGYRKKIKLNVKNPWWQAFSIVRTLILVWIAQYFACSSSPQEAFLLIKGTFSGWQGINFVATLTAIMSGQEWLIVGVASAIVLAVDIVGECGKDVCVFISRTFFPLRWFALIALVIAVLVFGCYGIDFDGAAFLYTQF